MSNLPTIKLHKKLKNKKIDLINEIILALLAIHGLDEVLINVS